MQLNELSKYIVLSTMSLLPITTRATNIQNYDLETEISAPSVVSSVSKEHITPETNLLFSYFNQLPSMRATLPTITAFPDIDQFSTKINTNKEPYIIGVPMPLPELAKSSAVQDNFTQIRTTTGNTLLGMRIHSPDAVGLRLGLLVENIPNEVAIAFFTEDSDTPVTTPVTGQHIKSLLNANRNSGDLSAAGRTYWSPIISDDKAIILLYVPSHIDLQDIRFSIPQASFIFQNSLIEKTAGSCNLDATCYPNWSTQASSVARMVFTNNGLTYTCTGSLLNDLDTSTTIPYFLSANHCISLQTQASSLQTDWFFQSETCNSSTLDPRYTTRAGGATLLYSSANTDTSFMRLNDQPPSGITYLGWTTDNLASNGTVIGIHHPSWDWKKISFGNLTDYLECTSNNHSFSCASATSANGEFLEIIWNNGITEGGSSGSIILNNDGQVVGQLYGGSSFCDNPQGTDIYGRFNLAYTAALNQWLGNGSTVTIPIAPSTLKATVVLVTQIKLNWIDNSNNEAGFKIERKTRLNGVWTQIATVGANITSYLNTGLTASTLYNYRIRSYNSAGNSAYSNQISATTLALPAPSNLRATVVSATQIKLNWIDNSNNETGFKIERKTGLNGAWGQIATVGANVLTYQNVGLTASTLYYYRIRSYNGVGNSAYSNQINASTFAAPALPIAPSNLRATVVSATQIKLNWTDNSSNETGFKIERKIGLNGSWGQIATAGTNVLTYQNVGLTASTLYYYRIRSYNGVGSSAYSNQISATTSAVSTSLLAPSNLIATAISDSQINLSWTDNNSNETGFKIERKTLNSAWGEIATVGANVSSYQNISLLYSMTYYYRISAYNSSGNSTYSNEDSATTHRW